ncbi:MAG: hypothetical protein ACUVTZ_01230 [Armatimonadota bacterium]
MSKGQPMQIEDQGREELAELFRETVKGYEALSPKDQDSVAAMAEALIRRDLPPEFVAAAVRSTSGLILELQAVEGSSGSRPVTPKQHPRKEAKMREREALLQNTRRILREARSAKQPYERKKLRRTLMSIDQAYLRRVLGRDAIELCAQINECLRNWRDLR